MIINSSPSLLPLPFRTEIIGFTAIVVAILLGMLFYRLRDFGNTLEDQETKLEQWRQEIYTQVQSEVFKGKKASMESVLSFATSLASLGVLKRDLDDLDKAIPRAIVIDLIVVAFTITVSVAIAIQPIWDTLYTIGFVLVAYAVIGDVFVFATKIKELFKIKRHIKERKIPSL